MKGSFPDGAGGFILSHAFTGMDPRRHQLPKELMSDGPGSYPGHPSGPDTKSEARMTPQSSTKSYSFPDTPNCHKTGLEN